MIEVKNLFYTLKVYATTIPLSDIFKVVHYTDFRGNCSDIPKWMNLEIRHTAHLDISKPQDVLLQNMKSNTRNEVRRAEREGIEVDYNCGVPEFIEYYNQFAEQKGIPKITEKNITKYSDFIICRARFKDNVLSMHANILEPKEKRATLLYSSSLRLCEEVDKKMIGWANRYLHYEEFVHLKEMGYNVYEWSGVCTDPEDSVRYNIGQFKMGFGSDNVCDCVNLSTPLFMLLSKIKRS